MHKPLPSVIALARFSFTDAQLEHARQLLNAETDWQTWIQHVELHGLSGFVNQHLDDYNLPIPGEMRMQLKVLKMRHAAASDARYQTLSEIAETFKASNIPFLGLKGAALMPYFYKHGFLRPMRDMDLLLPRNVLEQAADCLRDIGYELPKSQPSKFMRDMHQLPNATKTIGGFTSSVELHHDGISREVTGHFYYPRSEHSIQQIQWGDLTFDALEDVQMLHQVTKHLEGLHSGAVLKLINVMDVIGFAEHVRQSGQWARLEAEYPHVVNTLRCLHLLTPLPEGLQRQVGRLPTKAPAGVGQIMGSLRSALTGRLEFKQRVRLLLSPSDWWLYLYYNVDPSKSLWWVKSVRHPMRISNWLIRRVYSGLLGG